MDITGIQSGFGGYRSPFTQESSKPAATSASARSTEAYRVNISEEARMLDTYAPGSKVVTVGNHQVIVAPDANGNYPSQQKLEEDWDRLARIPQSSQDLIPYATVTIGPNGIDAAREKAYNELTPQEREDHSEYYFKVANAFRDEYLSRDMTFTEYENLTRNNETLRDEIDLALRERLYADPRAVELMKQFGVAT